MSARDSLHQFRYDEAGKCLDCGGVGGCHSLSCADSRSLFEGFRQRRAPHLVTTRGGGDGR